MKNTTLLSGHESVLCNEVIAGLEIEPGNIVVDGTINGGGHAELIANMIGEKGVLLGIDMDTHALQFSRERLKDSSAKILLHEGNYRHLDTYLLQEGIQSVDRFIFDLGLSSRQLDSKNRGFSFRYEEPLLMTFNPEPGEGVLTALEIVNTWDEENIADIIFGYGDEKYAKRIAHEIVLARTTKKIETTGDLVSIIERAVPNGYRKGKIHPATKTFQALRTTVNDEIESLREGIEKAAKALAPNGRIAVITFHSIEDRVVKNAFRQLERDGVGKRLYKKPQSASDEEIAHNPRARSAKLRVFVKNEKDN